MGGRGSTSGIRNSNINANSVIGNEKPITVDVTYRGGYYGEVFSAKAEGNAIVIDYNQDTEWEKVSKTTSIVHHNLKAGIYSTSNKVNQYDAYTSYDYHNINWDKVNEVKGKTYHLNEFLKKKGFKWDKTKKAWIKS